MNLEITILLALVVFLLIVGETLPPTPDAIPALGKFLLEKQSTCRHLYMFLCFRLV